MKLSKCRRVDCFMYHLAIMKKSWELLPKILAGTKTIESRWYQTRRAPWGKISKGDVVYFQDSGKKITVKALVSGVDQYEIRDNNHALDVFRKYTVADLGVEKIGEEIIKYITDKKYAIFIHLSEPKSIKPFIINKTGYGKQTAWITFSQIK